MSFLTLSLAGACVVLFVRAVYLVSHLQAEINRLNAREADSLEALKRFNNRMADYCRDREEWNATLLAKNAEIEKVRIELDTTAKHNGDLQTRIAALEEQARAQATTAANCETFRTTITELQDHLDSERKCYHDRLTEVGGEVMELHREIERLKDLLATAGVRPPEQHEREPTEYVEWTVGDRVRINGGRFNGKAGRIDEIVISDTSPIKVIFDDGRDVSRAWFNSADLRVEHQRTCNGKNCKQPLVRDDESND